MLFNSFNFFIFFTLVYCLYRILPHRGQNSLLLVASYVFYGAWDWRFLGLIFISTLTDYIVGQKIYTSTSRGLAKRWLAVSLIVNLSLLGFFKYFNFFAVSFASFMHQFGVEPNITLLNIILPVGISFYTFQTLTYSIDIYQKNLKPTDHFLDFALFVSFFPQLVAGPIERAKHLLPQILHPRTLTSSKNQEGLWLILWGLFKKVVIADQLALWVNQWFSLSSTLSGPQVWVASWGFAIQIYCDFSAYSDIARGVAKLLGFDLMLNFNLPFFAHSPADFWRRWHISLSTWLRDYLYIPLGGNRKSNGQTCRNLMLTMCLGGLWHGAAWTFVLWGLYQGLLLVLHRQWRYWTSWRCPRWLSIGVTFQLMAIGWLIFRAENFTQLGDMLGALVFDGSQVSQAIEALFQILRIAWPLVAVQCIQVFTQRLDLYRLILPWQQTIFASFFCYMIFVYGVMEAQQFIYFQF